jgi:hypothetical protein
MSYPNGFGDADLDTFFADFSVVVAWPAQGITGTGIYDTQTETHDFATQRSEVQVGVLSLLVKTGMFPGLKKNDPLMVDGVLHYVSKVDLEADGRTSRIALRLV